STTLQSEIGYWLAESRKEFSHLPSDWSRGWDANTVASVGTVSVSLNADETRKLLQDVPAAYHTQVNDILLTALLQAFVPWIGSRTLLVDLEGHGREEIVDDMNLSRTVGWFTSRFPVLLRMEGTGDLADTLKSVKEQLRQIPNRGIGYG